MLFTPYSFAMSDFSSEDDLDRLFQRLPPLEPPREVVTQILSRIRRLPRPAAISPSNGQDTPAGGSRDTLIVHNEMREPS